MMKTTTTLLMLAVSVAGQSHLLGAAAAAGQPTSIPIPVSTPANHAAMSEDGTLYLVRDLSLYTLKAGSTTVEPVDLGFIPRIHETEGRTVLQHYFLCVAFRGTEPMFLWTARTDSGYSTYVSSLSSHATILLQRWLVANGLAISPNGDFYILGDGPDLKVGIHRFSKKGEYLQSFHGDPNLEAKNVLSTDTGIFVTPELPGDAVHEYSFTGELQRTYNFDQVVESGKTGAVLGAFVKDGTVYVEMAAGQRNCARGVDCYFGGLADTSRIYRLEKGQLVFDSNSRADTILYGIAPDGTRVGRSLLPTARGNLMIVEPDSAP